MRKNLINLRKNPQKSKYRKVIYAVEPKFDGIGISLTYEDGVLTKAVTREMVKSER